MLNITVGMTLAQAEEILIKATLEANANNKSLTASILGVTPKTIHAKLNQYKASE